jgi:hypothetical protein
VKTKTKTNKVYRLWRSGISGCIVGYTFLTVGGGRFLKYPLEDGTVIAL